ncbi:PAS domain S-box protein [Paucibacter oligotrophus]|uniref:histidine kinase n=1 Tax=Roseateles oligotrophus TaxID=1769250 RepID=A0ABT2YCM8_9BURK|nr:PAS domain S-box protein [Roseateles oligotrophus]
MIWLVNLVFALVLGAMLWISHQQQLQHARERTENTSLTLERGLSGMLNQIDLLLLLTQDALENGMVGGQLDTQMVRRVINRAAPQIAGTVAVFFSDAQGQVAGNSGFPLQHAPLSIQDRDYFRQLRENPARGVVSSKPLIGRSSGKWAILFSRAYRNPGGNFAGVILVSVDLERFSGMFAALKLGERSRIAMIDQDFARIAAYPVPSDTSLLGKRMQQEAVIQQLQTGIESLTTTITTMIDGVERIYAFRKLESRPYWIMSALSVQDELQAWRHQLAFSLVFMLAFSAFSACAALLLQRGWRRQEESQVMLASTIEASDNGIMVTDAGRKLIHCNRNFLAMWRLPAAHGDEMAVLMQMRAQLRDSEAFLAGVEALHAARLSEEVATLYLQDGRIFERSSMPMLVADQPAGRVWSFRDITERKRAEEQLLASAAMLRESEHRFRDLVNSSDGIVWEADAQTFQFTFISDKAERLLGFPVGDWLVPGFWVSHLHPDDQSWAPAYCASCTGRLQAHDFEYRFIAQDGRTVWLHDIVAVVEEQGAPRWLRGLMIDITAHKQAEQDLQGLLKEKTALLLEVHHRVKNNLQVISSLLRLESSRSKEAPTKAVLQDMQSRVRSMALLHETIYRQGNFAAIDLGGYIGQIARESLKSLQLKPGAVQLRLDMSQVQVGLDQAAPAGMLISELVSNSLKHGFPDGHSGEICITLQPLPEPGHWCMQVTDSGIGLPVDFELRRQGSMGLQLAVDLANQMGGTLHIGAGPQVMMTVNFKAQVPAPIEITLGGERL